MRRTRDPVIVKAFGSEPVLMYCVRVHWFPRRESLVEVTRTPSATGPQRQTLRLPIHMVFRFTEERYRRLRRAYESGDQQELSSAWEEARPYECEAMT